MPPFAFVVRFSQDENLKEFEAHFLCLTWPNCQINLDLKGPKKITSLANIDLGGEP